MASYSSEPSSKTEGFFADEGTFAWYSDAPWRLDDVAAQRKTVAAYLDERRAVDDHLQLRTFQFTGVRAEDDTAHFGMSLLREARDAAAREVEARGAVDCSSGKFVVLSLAA